MIVFPNVNYLAALDLCINCEYSASLWTEVKKWINRIGFLNYKIDNKIKRVGNMKKRVINLILLSTKQSLHVNRV